MTLKVGIFFVVNSHLLIDAVPLAESEQYGLTFGYGGHYQYWQNLNPSNPQEELFKTKPYDYFARGRVVYFTQKKHYVIYADKCLSRQVLSNITQAFILPHDRLKWSGDEHYQCANCCVDYLE